MRIIKAFVAEYTYVNNRNGQFIMKILEEQQGMGEAPLILDDGKGSRAWHVEREYQEYFSAEEAVGQVIRAHMQDEKE